QTPTKQELDTPPAARSISASPASLRPLPPAPACPALPQYWMFALSHRLSISTWLPKVLLPAPASSPCGQTWQSPALLGRPSSRPPPQPPLRPCTQQPLPAPLRSRCPAPSTGPHQQFQACGIAPPEPAVPRGLNPRARRQVAQSGTAPRCAGLLPAALQTRRQSAWPACVPFAPGPLPSLLKGIQGSSRSSMKTPPGLPALLAQSLPYATPRWRHKPPRPAPQARRPPPPCHRTPARLGPSAPPAPQAPPSPGPPARPHRQTTPRATRPDPAPRPSAVGKPPRCLQCPASGRAHGSAKESCAPCGPSTTTGDQSRAAPQRAADSQPANPPAGRSIPGKASLPADPRASSGSSESGPY